MEPDCSNSFRHQLKFQLIYLYDTEKIFRGPGYILFVRMIQTGENYQHGQYGTNTLGSIIRRNWSGIFYLWEKTTGGSAINNWCCVMYLPLLYIQCISAGNRRLCFNGNTVFYKDIKRPIRNQPWGRFFLQSFIGWLSATPISTGGCLLSTSISITCVVCKKGSSTFL